VSAPLDLAACARRIGERDNRVYEARFMRKMRQRLCATGRYQRRQFAGLRSLWELDDRFTAPPSASATRPITTEPSPPSATWKDCACPPS